MPRLLLLFTFMNLVVGTGAFVIGGTLEPLAQALGVSVAAAGQAMTAYALSTAVLAPLALLATGRWSRRSALVTALTLFTAGSALCAWAPSLGWLLLGRVLMGIGAFCTPVAAGIAVALVPRERQGQALARVFLGISLSYVVGVPLGAWLGYTHGGAMPLAVATGLSALAGLVVALGVPRHLETPGASFTGLGSLLRKPEVLRVLGLTLLYFTAIFSVFSYIGPVLRALVPLTPVQLSLTLAAFGLSGVAGTLMGGWANDRFGALRSLRVQLSVLGLTMAVLPLTAGQPLAMVGTLLVWGLAGFGMVAPQQSRLAGIAPSQAAVLLSLNASMLYAGTAVGAVLGGAATATLGLQRLAWIGVPLALVGLLLLRSPRRR
ncbi:MAG: MFS transporter [Rubrivivax sp.]|jgi:DHA1 family inner membrane transport protein